MNTNNSEVNHLKRRILEASYHAKEGHVASAFSILDLIFVIYEDILRVNHNVKPELNDRFVLSKGHASLALYAVLENKGLIGKDLLTTFCQYNSILGGHPDTNKVSHIEVSSGSLGHGFPIALGLAIGSKIKKIDNKIICLIGDGECNEGTVWETALLASHHNLDNLICIVDFNHSTDRALSLNDLGSKFRSFGWNVIGINGHNHQEISDALNEKSINKPQVVIAETVKGKGIKQMEGNPAWHHKSPNKTELTEFLKELS